MDNELLLFDRLEVIKKTIQDFGEENFYLSFSGGKDSTVVHHLLDMALPGNTIPRVFINTGIEYVYIVQFVKELAKNDPRIVILNPGVNIKQMLEKDGYPFKSKEHSLKVGQYKLGSRAESVLRYKEGFYGRKSSSFQCPQKLLYQYNDEFTLRISDKCCYRLKKEPIHKWEKQNNRTIALTGMRNSEGGQRANIDNCIITRKGKVVKFHPLIKVNDEWEEWFIQEYNIQLCKLYYPPYNFERTGCKGCPFAIHLQRELDTLTELLPAEKKQCELLWGPVYKEYRRIGYRLRKERKSLF